MTSAGPWGAIPQAEAVAEAAEVAIERAEESLPKKIEENFTGKNHVSGSSTDTDTSSDLEKVASAQDVARVAKLARQLTQHSIRTEGGNDYPNPFFETDDPALNPTSGQFKPEAWIRTLIGIQSRDPERYPQRTAGVAYRNLNVHGFGSLTDYQKYVLSRMREDVGISG